MSAVSAAACTGVALLALRAPAYPRGAAVFLHFVFASSVLRMDRACQWAGAPGPRPWKPSGQANARGVGPRSERTRQGVACVLTQLFYRRVKLE